MSTRTSRKRKLADTDLVPAEQMNQNPTKRRETTVGMVIDFLEELRRAKHPEKEKKKEAKPWHPNLRQKVTMDFKAYVVYLRHGSLTEPGPKWHTFKKISEMTGVRLKTAFEIVKRWKEDGFKVINKRLGQRPRAKW